jgi:membrane protease YdiL (CAAX protease family)
MKNQKLLENKEDNVIFLNTVIIILLLLFFSIIFSFISTKFLKFISLEAEVFFAGILTFVIELSILIYLFYRFPEQFLCIFKNRFTGFFMGILYYFMSLPFLLILVSISFNLFKKYGFEPIPQELIFIYLFTKSIPLLIFLFFFSCFFAPFFEEIIFRGFLYTAIKKKFSVPLSVFITSLIFSLFHPNVFIFCGIFLLSLILTYLFEKTQNLWVPIGIHFANNFFTNLLIFILKFYDFKLFY